MDLKFFLEDLIGRKVDLITATGIRAEIRNHIQKDLIRVA
jgi:predicted nucleotidyltransferase